MFLRWGWGDVCGGWYLEWKDKTCGSGSEMMIYSFFVFAHIFQIKHAQVQVVDGIGNICLSLVKWASKKKDW